MNYLKKIPPLFIVLIVALLSTFVLFILILNNKFDSSTIRLLTFIITVVNAFITIVSFVATYKKKKKYYISCSVYDVDTADAITRALLNKTNAEVVSIKNISAGSLIKEAIKNHISSSSICFVLIGSQISESQKWEIKEMKENNKKIIPILLSDDSVLPRSLRNFKPLTREEFEKLI